VDVTDDAARPTSEVRLTLDGTEEVPMNCSIAGYGH
jgi:hypothetical protein